MRFRRKRAKVEQPNVIDEQSDDELDDSAPMRIFGLNPLLNPSASRQKLGKTTRDILRVHLHHGDILIQQGADLQKFYEVEIHFIVAETSMLLSRWECELLQRPDILIRTCRKH
jgi:hypothetical protein